MLLRVISFRCRKAVRRNVATVLKQPASQLAQVSPHQWRVPRPPRVAAGSRRRGNRVRRARRRMARRRLELPTGPPAGAHAERASRHPLAESVNTLPDARLPTRRRCPRTAGRPNRQGGTHPARGGTAADTVSALLASFPSNRHHIPLSSASSFGSPRLATSFANASRC